MNIKIAMLLLCLAGCGGGAGDEGSNNHGYGFAYDVQGATGLKLRYTPILTSADPMSNPIFLENIFAQVETCTGMSAPAPFVILVPPGSMGIDPDTGLTILGKTDRDPNLILIGDPDLSIPRHEYIHYLLIVNTGDGDGKHKSKFFDLRSNGGCA